MIQSDLHILYLPSWYPSTPSDLTGSFFREQAIALSKFDIKVGVVSVQTSSLKNLALTSKYQAPYVDQGVNTYSKQIKNWFFFASALRAQQFTYVGLKLFKQYIKDHGRPDVIHVHSMLYAGALALAIKEKYKIPYVLSEHSSAFSRKLIKSGSLKFLRKCAQNAEQRYGVSQNFANQVEHIIGRRWGAWGEMPNSVSDEFLTYPLSNKKNDKFEFIHVSFMTENKRVDGIIRSFYEVQKKIPNVFLTLVGDGKCRKELETLTADLNISEHVHFTGMMARKDVVMKMNAADVFIMNSEHESFGVVLIEALALGKSVISTKSGGPDTIVTSDVGYLVDVDAPEKLTEFMIKITSERNKFRPNNIRKVCESRYSSKALVRRWKEIYMGILNTPFS